MSLFGRPYHAAPSRTTVTVTGPIYAYESLSWRPVDVRVGLVRGEDGELICAREGEIDWHKLDGTERIALGYLLSKALGHPVVL